jgi:alpha-L-rhamnosidase
MKDNQREEGQIADIIPSSGWGYGVNPVWSAVLCIIPMNLYLYTGDLQAVEKATPLCENYLRFLKGHETEYGSIKEGLGDWVPQETRTPEEFTSTCYYYLINDYVRRFKELVGEDGSLYAKEAARLKELLNTRFFDEATQLYSNGSQAAQGTALFLGIVPKEREAAVAEGLSQMVRENGNCLDFGMLGSKTVLRMLTRYGHVDQAVEMALQQEAPSWAKWIADGHTTPPEEWVLKSGTSLNHVFLGDINAWMYNCLAGINYDAKAPGFRHILIEPHFPKRLQWAEAQYESVVGKIATRWEREEGSIVLNVEIPVNTTATVKAANQEYHIGAGHHTFRLAE